jgi:membrane protease YdiL (CAAX protease family)
VSALSPFSDLSEEQQTARRLALGYLAAVAVAEFMVVLVEPRLGLVVQAVLLVILLAHAALSWERSYHPLLLGLSFAPLIRLLSLSLPLARFPLVYWYFITSVPLFIAVSLAMRVMGFSFQAVGVNRRSLLSQLMVSFSGLAFGYLEYQILRPLPLAKAFTWRHLWLPAIVLMVSTGFMEELVFRGLLQRATGPLLGRFSVPYVSALFAVLHVGYRSVLDVLFVFAVALFFGYVAEKTQSIVGVSLSHGLTNITLFLVMPFVH